ncbi:hypothetical protein G9A89_011501 [Geosiphon pyriformis]|nr:hypothetical protein G9A89_011501 [Geosiphon pyriformis]
MEITQQQQIQSGNHTRHNNSRVLLQRFNIPDGIEVVKKSVYQYIENCINHYLFGNYNILEVRNNLYNNLVHYSQLGTEDLNSKTLTTYFQELNFNIIEYCEEKYPVQPKYFFNFESETETSNKGKQKVKQYLRTIPNTPILPKTTAKHLQTPEQGTSVKLPLSITPFPILLSPKNPTQQQEPILTSANIIDYLQKNENNYSESLESEETEPEQEEASENEEKMATAYIAKIPEFMGEDNDTSPQEWLDKIQKAEDANAGLKNKLIKKVCPHASADLTTAIRHAKNYEMAIEKANHTKLVNLAIGETSSAAEKKIDQLTKKNNNNKINPNNQLVLQNSGQQRPNHYHIQSSYFTIPEESDFQQPAFSEGKVAAPKSNPSNNTIPSAQIAQNANFSDIFPFEFETNKSPFLLSNAAANEQKTITAMYTKATVEEKLIRLILDSGSAGSIITYQLIQQLQRTIDRPAQTVIITADGMKKTPVREIDNFLFIIDEITILELKISYQEQYTIVSATCVPVFEFEEEKEMLLTKTYMALGSTSNWAEETEQKIFEESRGWKKEYETRICYFCKACHRERFESPKRNMLSEECNWIDVAMRGRVCNQTCQYVLSISEKVRRRTLFDAAYNSALNKLYHYLHDAEIIFDLAMALINGTT